MVRILRNLTNNINLTKSFYDYLKFHNKNLKFAWSKMNDIYITRLSENAVGTSTSGSNYIHYFASWQSFKNYNNMTTLLPKNLDNVFASVVDQLNVMSEEIIFKHYIGIKDFAFEINAGNGNLTITPMLIMIIMPRD